MTFEVGEVLYLLSVKNHKIVPARIEAITTVKKLEKEILFLEKKLYNPSFIKKAPLEVIEKDRNRQTELGKKKSKLVSHLQTVKQVIE